MNEPPSIERKAMFETWQACEAAVHQVLPDMAVGVMDTGEGPLPLGNIGLSAAQVSIEDLR
jgi:hypothetical protein